ncbi:hypothetical protein CGZ75_01495 [Paenibacillus herberti]|uniref:Helix-turn-helix domain-containing protein n=2 Tax=Paenibacillus herberti TaxID=1619309 RepID=A0A229P575_9BACL|nr:hypothetical protein CGZ75_01495 [Paenibacillus herberti]
MTATIYNFQPADPAPTPPARRAIIVTKPLPQPISAAQPVRKTIDVKAAAEQLGVSTTTIYQLCREKQIPHIRIRARLFFHTDVLDEWLRSGGTLSSEALS